MRNLLAGQAQRVASAVPCFVVMSDDRQHVAKLVQVGKNPVADFRVQLDVLEFRVRQVGRFPQDAIVDADFADVVQQARQVNSIELASVAAEFRRQCNRNSRDTIAMAAGICVFGIDGRCEPERSLLRNSACWR